MVKELIPEVQGEFADFMVENMQKHGLTKDKVKIKITVVEKNPLNENECRLGGIWVYAHHGHIVFKNTVESRLDLCYENSIPDIKKQLFPNMQVIAGSD